MGTAQKFDLCWIVDGQCKEVIIRNANKALVLWKKKQLENSTHKTGKLTYLENGTHKF